MKQDNDADVKSAEVANSNVPGANDVSSADARENGASRNMTKFTVRFHWFSGSRSGCTYTGEVSVVAKTEEAAEAIVREDFSASFTDVSLMRRRMARSWRLRLLKKRGIFAMSLSLPRARIWNIIGFGV